MDFRTALHDLQSVFHLSPGIFRCTHVFSGSFCRKHHNTAIFCAIKNRQDTMHFLQRESILFCRFFVSLLRSSSMQSKTDLQCFIHLNARTGGRVSPSGLSDGRLSMVRICSTGQCFPCQSTAIRLHGDVGW